MPAGVIIYQWSEKPELWRCGTVSPSQRGPWQAALNKVYTDHAVVPQIILSPRHGGARSFVIFEPPIEAKRHDALHAAALGAGVLSFCIETIDAGSPPQNTGGGPAHAYKHYRLQTSTTAPRKRGGRRGAI